MMRETRRLSRTIAFHPAAPVAIAAASVVVLLFLPTVPAHIGTAWLVLAACSGYALSGSV